MIAHATAKRTQRDSNPHSPIAPTPLSTRVPLPIEAMRPVILFRITGWRITPGADRRPLLTAKVSGFRGRTNLDRQAKDYQWSFLGRSLRPVAAFSTACFSIRTAYKRSRVGLGAPYFNGVLIIPLGANACPGLVSSQGLHPLSAAVAAIEKS